MPGEAEGAVAAAAAGNRQSSHGDQYCILDAYWHAADETYYVMDIMCWAGAAVYDCNFEFRAFWLQCKLAECVPPPHAPHAPHAPLDCIPAPTPRTARRCAVSLVSLHSTTVEILCLTRAVCAMPTTRMTTVE